MLEYIINNSMYKNKVGENKWGETSANNTPRDDDDNDRATEIITFLSSI